MDHVPTISTVPDAVPPPRVSGWRKLRLAAAGLALAVPWLGGIMAPATVLANGSCVDPGHTSRFSGMLTHTPTYQVTGDLMDRPMSLCSGGTSLVSAWLMIQGDDSDEYAQIGYLKYSGGSSITFTEFSSGHGGSYPDYRQRTYGGIFSNGTTHSYTVAYNFTTDKIVMLVDNSQK